jgi:AcrR family transcriptional regulator
VAAAGTQPGHSGLPRQVLRTWQEPPPRRDTLTADRITAAAIRIADQEGISALTIRRLSASMGHATMAVYRHISSRDELVLLMMDSALGPPPRLRPDEPWQAGLRRWAAGLFERYLRHPWLLDVPAPGMPVTPHHAMWVEHALAITSRAGLTTSQRLEAALLIDGHLRIIAALARAAPPAAQADQQQALADLRTVADEQRFPNFRSVLETGELQDDAAPGIDFGLDVILSGLVSHAGATAGLPPQE